MAIDFDSDNPIESPGTNVNIYRLSDQASASILPQIWNDLIPLQPQARRSYLLREALKIPLTFDLVFFEFEISYSTWVISLVIIRKYWDFILKENLGITIFIAVAFTILYFGLKFFQYRNEKQIIQELIYNSFTMVFAAILASYTVYKDLL